MISRKVMHVTVTKTIPNPYYEVGAGGIRGHRCLCDGLKIMLVIEDGQSFVDGAPFRTTAVYLSDEAHDQPILSKGLPSFHEWTNLPTGALQRISQPQTTEQ